MNTATVPVPKLEEDFYDWYARHEAKRREAAARSHDLVFIGDSITHFLEGHHGFPGRGERLWAALYAGRNALNLGFGWDRTQNVLWRLEHGEFEGQRPRLTVVLIGTNNLTGTVNAPTNSPAEIAEGVMAVCSRVADAAPAGRILLMGLFPRGPAADPLRAAIRATNALLAAEAARRDRRMTFLDIGDRFLGPSGEIPQELMNDGVHPTEAGYRIWTTALEPIIRALC